MKFFPAMEDHFEADKEEIRAADYFYGSKSPDRCREQGRQSESGGARVKNATDHDAKGGSDACGTAVRDASSENIGGVRAGSQVEQDAAYQKQGEVMYSEHQSDFTTTRIPSVWTIAMGVSAAMNSPCVTTSTT